MKLKDDHILIVNPRMFHHSQTDNFLKYPPLGLLYLSSYAKSCGYEVDLLDLSVYQDWVEVLKNTAKSKKYHLIGISGTTPTHENIKQIAATFKKYNGSCKIVSGGPHATFVGKEILENMDVDIVVKGEGEIAFVKILDHFFNQTGELADIHGIMYREEQEIIDTGKNNVINHLDSLPFPSWEKINMNYYAKDFFPIITSRGCPSKCIFCSAGAMAGGVYRRRSNENIIQEIQALYQQHGINKYLFSDNTFTVNGKQTVDLCRKMRELPFDIAWYCESRIDALNDELVEQMIKSGCMGLQIGIESANQEILNISNKQIQIKDTIKKLSRVLALGMNSVYCTFVLGLPGETQKTLSETMNLMRTLKSMGISVYASLATPFPGTYLCEHAEELGFMIEHKKWNRYFFDEVTALPDTLDVKTLREYFVEASQLAI